MTFLAPLFLLGAAAIAGPIIVHLIRRSTKEKTPFSSLMFLQPTPPRVTRRSRLENIWLLLLRCLVILLLALGFARPFFQQTAETRQPAETRKRSVILLDASASMRRGDLWKQAIEKVKTHAKAAAPDDEIAVVAFSRELMPVMSFEDWRRAPMDQRVTNLLQHSRGLEPGFGRTHIGAALLHAAELLDAGREVTSAGEIVLVSDLQEGAKLDGLQGFAWPKGTRVTIDRVESAQLENASAQWLAEAAQSGEPQETLRLRVQNAPGAKTERFLLRWDPAPPAPGLDVYVPAGQSRVTKTSKPPGGSEKLVLSGDGVDFDNTLYVVPPEPAHLNVLFLGNDAAADSQGALYFLGRSFPESRQQVVELTPRPPDPAPSAYDLQRAHLLVLGEGITEATVSAAREFARSGRMVLYPVASAAAGPALAKMLGVPAVEVEEARSNAHALLGSIDFTHPLFTPFADPRFSDFSKIRFWRHRVIKTIPEDAKVLARFDDKSPALIQASVGNGSVLILATTWKPIDGQMALSSKFVPLMQAILEQSSGMAARPAQCFVGDPVSLPQGPAPFRVRMPDGAETEVAAGGVFTGTKTPGVYTVNPGNWKIAVNLSPEESRVAPMDTARLTSLGIPLGQNDATAVRNAAQTAAAVQAAELEAQQKIWRWLLLGALVVLLIETIIAARISQPSRQPVSS